MGKGADGKKNPIVANRFDFAGLGRGVLRLYFFYSDVSREASCGREATARRRNATPQRR